MDINNSIEQLIEKAPRLKSTDAQMVLRDQYETTYGIYNHAAEGADHPFALILQHWSEDSVTHGSLHERMNHYIDHDIQKYFGLSFTDFIEQPTYVIQMQLEIAQDRIKKEAPLAEAARNALDAMNKK